MKNIFLAFVIMLVGFIACDTPQPATGSSTDTSAMPGTTDTTVRSSEDTTRR